MATVRIAWLIVGLAVIGIVSGFCLHMASLAYLSTGLALVMAFLWPKAGV